MEQMQRAKALFKGDVEAGLVQFSLRMDSHNWEMPSVDHTFANEGPRQQYGLLGWRCGKIYADFIFAADKAGDGRRLTVLETKGNQSQGNLDTALLDCYQKSLRATTRQKRANKNS